MANLIKIKRSSTPGGVPSSLSDGEIAINQADKILFFKDSGGTIRSQKIGFTVISPGQQVYSSGITWSGTTAPSGATTHTYNWQQVGNLVTLQICLSYATAGSAVGSVVLQIPSDLPAPLKPTGLGDEASEVWSFGYGKMNTTAGTFAATGQSIHLRRNSANTADEIYVFGTSSSYKSVTVTVTYFTA